MMNESQDTQAQPDKNKGFTGAISRHPVAFAALVGGIASLILPIYSVAWKISTCNYGWDTDYSGVCICVPMFVVVGAVGGAVGGFIGKATGRWFERKTEVDKPHFIGSLVGGLLGGLVGLVAGAIPAFMFAFPNC